MKKHVSILLGLMVIFSSLFTSCNNEEELDPNICKITVNSEGNGTVAITDYIGTSVNVLIGNIVEVVATPDDGWAFIGWYISGTEAPASTDAAFTFITSENVTLTARFAKLSDIIIRSGGNGRVAFKGATGNSIPVVPGTEVTVIATPYKDCDFIGWFVADEGSPISTDTEYTFTVTEDINLTAKFSKRPVVTIRSTDNGNVVFKDYSGTSVAVLPNTEVTVIATPNENCDFVGWFVANEESPISTDAEYIFKVEQNITLTAKFSKRPTVSIHSAGYGSVSFKDYPNNTVVVLPNTEVIVIATPNEDCNFVGWFVDDEENSLSTNAEYSFTVTEDIVITAKFANSIKAVDLGLPSGIKWANMNVGARNPEESGGYYAWGEVDEKENYSWETYKWCEQYAYKMFKYCERGAILEPDDDAAHVKWGNSWRIPTYAEQKELCENCTWELTKVNGIYGYTIIGPNGNSIFLPATGYRDGVELDKRVFGYYWLNLSDKEDARFLFFDHGSPRLSEEERCLGFCIRPVCE